jgi:hypothetical protein
MYELHAVIINKDYYDLPSSKKIAQSIINDKNRKFYRETEQSYRFRNIPKTKFVKKSFRSKKVKDGITLVLCDGGNKIEEFKILSKYIKKGDFIMAHDYARDEKKFLDDINLKFWNWHEIQESDISNACETNGLEKIQVFRETLKSPRFKIEKTNSIVESV